jgi:polysaccharide pyruvyl transferase WcaK-like protein
MRSASKKVKKIAFWGNFGVGNLGNECTLQAIIYNTQTRIPDAELICICAEPEDVSARHKIKAIPVHEKFFGPWPWNNRLILFLRKIVIGIPGELCRWVKALKILKDTDMLIMPGTQFLSDNLSKPLGWPYRAFKWSVISKICRCRLLFVSVGVGPLRRPLSKLFVKAALSLADYRSYRDNLSKQYLLRIGFDSMNDQIYPDLAFSLSEASMPTSAFMSKTSVVALGVKNYEGQYGPLPRLHEADDIYQLYINKIVTFMAWLLEHKYTVQLVIGDLNTDPQVLADVKMLLFKRKIKYKDVQIIDEQIDTVEKLISHLATSNIVVSSRFHNVILGLLLNKPVFALSYSEKFAELMQGFDLARYEYHIDQLDVNPLIESFTELEKSSDKVKERISRKVEEYRNALEKQYMIMYKAGRKN